MRTRSALLWVAVSAAVAASAAALLGGCADPGIPSYRKSPPEQVGRTPDLKARCPDFGTGIEGEWLSEAIIVGYDHSAAHEADKDGWRRHCLER